MKLKIIHQVLTFKQAQCLQPYIDFNTEKKETGSNFEKDRITVCMVKQ